MAIVKNYHIIRVTRHDHNNKPYFMYAQGWGKFSKNITEARCYCRVITFINPYMM